MTLLSKKIKKIIGCNILEEVQSKISKSGLNSSILNRPCERYKLLQAVTNLFDGSGRENDNKK